MRLASIDPIFVRRPPIASSDGAFWGFHFCQRWLIDDSASGSTMSAPSQKLRADDFQYGNRVPENVSHDGQLLN
jgi:hypothetical protein